MRHVMLIWLLAGCGDSVGGAPDLASFQPDLTGDSRPLCPEGADGYNFARCHRPEDTKCRGRRYGEDCFCKCDGYWECDLIGYDGGCG